MRKLALVFLISFLIVQSTSAYTPPVGEIDAPRDFLLSKTPTDHDKTKVLTIGFEAPVLPEELEILSVSYDLIFMVPAHSVDSPAITVNTDSDTTTNQLTLTYNENIVEKLSTLVNSVTYESTWEAYSVNGRLQIIVTITMEYIYRAEDFSLIGKATTDTVNIFLFENKIDQTVATIVNYADYTLIGIGVLILIVLSITNRKKLKQFFKK